MKDIKDYLHLYIGCECMIGDMKWKREEHLYGLAPDVDVDFGKPIKSKLDAHVLSVFSDKCTLILRPLSDMTEEEALYCISTFDRGVDNPVFKIIGKDELGEDWVYVQVGYEETECCWGPNLNYMGAEMFRYLLSRGFDLFGLIESGLAIDKTSIPSNQEMK